MEFSVNSPILFVLAGIIVAAVMGQSVFFLVKAWKRGREIGMEPAKLKRIARTAAIFTIAPAVSIVISVIVLSKDLGIALPWLRLSVIGSLSYEAVAAENALAGFGLKLGELQSPLTAQQFVTIATVMTISIMVGIWLAPIISKRYQKGMLNIEKKDKKWSEILSNSLFIGMISAFIGFVFCDVTALSEGETYGLVPVFVFIVSALVMAGAGILVKKKPGWRWVSDYALPASLIIGMASAIPFTLLFGSSAA